MSDLPVVYAGIKLADESVNFSSDRARLHHIEDLKIIIYTKFRMAVIFGILTEAVSENGIKTITSIASEELWSTAKTALESEKHIGILKKLSEPEPTPRVEPPKRMILKSAAQMEAEKLEKLAHEEKLRDAQAEKLAKMAVGIERPKIRYSIKEYRRVKKQQEEENEKDRHLPTYREEVNKLMASKENIKQADHKRSFQSTSDSDSDKVEPVIVQKKARQD